MDNTQLLHKEKQMVSKVNKVALINFDYAFIISKMKINNVKKSYKFFHIVFP